MVQEIMIWILAFCSVKKKIIKIICLSRKDKIRNNIVKKKMNVTRSLLEDIKTKQLKWYGHVQRMLWNGAHQEEENEVDLNLPGKKRLEDWWRKRD